MKSTLTSADPSGWYLCNHSDGSIDLLRYWNGSDSMVVTDYTNFRRLFTESDVAALRQALAGNEALVAESVKGAEQVNEELRTLREELSRLKSQPYVMRRADKPDCVGIWCDKEAEILTIEEPSELSFPFLHPPYYYLGPIPIVVEQQPPRVVTIRNKRTGKESLAIPQMRDGKPEYYFLLLADGTVSGDRVWCNNWEEVQP